MAEYRIRETGEIVMNLASVFPNTSLPVALSQGDFDALGIDPVFEGPQPQSAIFQTTYRDGVEQIGDKWFTKYAVADMGQDAIDALTAQHWKAIRDQRNAALEACDWTQLPDAPLSNVEMQDWASYRQALRDITTQSNPFNIQWPTAPGA